VILISICVEYEICLDNSEISKTSELLKYFEKTQNGSIQNSCETKSDINY